MLFDICKCVAWSGVLLTILVILFGSRDYVTDNDVVFI